MKGTGETVLNMFAAKRWRQVRFTEDEIQADPGLTVTTLRGPRTPSKIKSSAGGRRAWR